MATTISGDTGASQVQDNTITTADIQDSAVTAPKVAGANGTSGQLLQSDGDGTMSWTDVPSPASLSTASGSAPSYSARAWVNFDGTGTVAIRESQNVSSVTDNGTGNYTVNFTTAMSDANHCPVGNATYNATGTSNLRRGILNFRDLSTTSVTLIPSSTGSDTPQDTELVTISIFR
jgi:hypothetical protein